MACAGCGLLVIRLCSLALVGAGPKQVSFMGPVMQKLASFFLGGGDGGLSRKDYSQAPRWIPSRAFWSIFYRAEVFANCVIYT